MQNSSSESRLLHSLGKQYMHISSTVKLNNGVEKFQSLQRTMLCHASVVFYVYRCSETTSSYNLQSLHDSPRVNREYRIIG